MKTLFFIQNGRGPGEITASIDMYNYYILAFILLIAVVYFTWSVYINYKKQKQ